MSRYMFWTLTPSAGVSAGVNSGSVDCSMLDTSTISIFPCNASGASTGSGTIVLQASVDAGSDSGSWRTITTALVVASAGTLIPMPLLTGVGRIQYMRARITTNEVAGAGLYLTVGGWMRDKGTVF